MSSSQGMLVALKNVLRSKGVPYSKIAEHLDLNETSVKRLMTGHTPMTFERMDQICDVVGIDFFDLMKLAKPTDSTESAQLSIDQEQALADDIYLFLAFYGSAKGLSANELIAKYKITQVQLQKALLQLQKLGLIELLAENRVKFLVPRTVRWNESGPLVHKYQSEMQTDFLNSGFVDSAEMRKFLTFPLSHRSKQIFARKLRELTVELQAQSEVDMALEKNLKSTATVLFAIREWTPALLSKFLK